TDIAANAGTTGIWPPSAPASVALSALMIQGTISPPANTAPPTVKVCAFFSTTRAMSLEAGQHSANVIAISAKTALAATPIAPSSVNTITTASAFDVAWKNP